MPVGAWLNHVIPATYDCLGIVASAPVGHNCTFISPFTAKNSVHKFAVFGRINSVYIIIGGHDCPRISLGDGDFEVFEIQFAKSPLTDAHIEEQPVQLLIVCGKMFQRCTNSLTLNTIDISGGYFPRNERVLRIIFKISPTKRITMKIHSGRKQYIYAIFTNLIANGRPDLIYERHIPS